MKIDEKFMKMALGLAAKAGGMTHPNPLVGSVVVKNGRVVGKGYHERYGLAHAEVNALRDAGNRAKGATLYVTLEPCDHFGRTPPCTGAIIRSGVRRVVAAMRDPNPLNNGRGLGRLKKAGIRTTTGILTDEARVLNAPYIKFITRKMPYVTLKMASSLDGKIATRCGDSKWITSDFSRRKVRAMRSKVDAVMVGANTAARDNPRLLALGRCAKQPVRIVVDSAFSTPLGARLFSGIRISPVVIAATSRAPRRKVGAAMKKGVNVVTCRPAGSRVDLEDLFRKLGLMGIVHVLVEGGGELAAGLIEKGLVDKFLFFISPKIIGGRIAVTSVEGEGVRRALDALDLEFLKISMSGPDILVEAKTA